MIKAIGTAARRELQRELGCQVHLDLSVRVRRDWRADEGCSTASGSPECAGPRPAQELRTSVGARARLRSSRCARQVELGANTKGTLTTRSRRRSRGDLVVLARARVRGDEAVARVAPPRRVRAVAGGAPAGVERVAPLRAPRELLKRRGSTPLTTTASSSRPSCACEPILELERLGDGHLAGVRDREVAQRARSSSSSLTGRVWPRSGRRARSRRTSTASAASPAHGRWPARRGPPGHSCRRACASARPA